MYTCYMNTQSRHSSILFVTDKNGLNLAEHSAAAALLTQSTKHYIIFCVGFKMPNENFLIKSAKRLGKVVEYRQLEMSQEITKNYQSKGAHSHVTSAALLKMEGIWSLRNEFDRVLYIDNDVLSMKDFNLDKLNFDGAPIAAVYDIAKVGSMDQGANFYEKCAKNGLSTHYFNSGVIAADLSVLAKVHVNLYKEALEAHTISCGYEENCSCNDQCAWNIAFSSNWKRMPLSNNFQACALFDQGWTNAIARHYVGRQKFLPIKLWRNDRKDTALISNARQLLHLTPTKRTFLDFIRRLNTFRNLRSRKSVSEALKKVSDMYKSDI